MMATQRQIARRRLQVKRLHREGWSARAIARELGVGIMTVTRDLGQDADDKVSHSAVPNGTEKWDAPGGAAGALTVADITDGLPQVEAGSVAAIVTDPPYARKFLHLLFDLGQVAARVLRPGGYCAVLTGHIDLDGQIRSLGSSLTYWWTYALFMTSGNYAQMFQRHLFVAWKPVLVFRRPPCDPPDKWTTDTIDAGEMSGRVRHQWEQGEETMGRLIELFSNPGDLVLDPFVGSGTTLVAAQRLGRRAIGSDADEAAISKARLRLEGGCNGNAG